jgi:redox-sensitive bicupin YhaK (pirin superfamily)
MASNLYKPEIYDDFMGVDEFETAAEQIGPVSTQLFFTPHPHRDLK